MIHKFKAKGLNILLDVNSGGVHLIDDVTYDLLDHAQPPFEEECPTKYIDALKTDYPRKRLKSLMQILLLCITTSCCLVRIFTEILQIQQ